MRVISNEKLRMAMVHGYAGRAVCGIRGPHNAEGWREISVGERSQLAGDLSWREISVGGR